MLLGAAIIAKVFESHNIDFVITEGTGAKHMIGSFHYKGLAIDIRSHDIPTDSLKYVILQECIQALGSDFDMILENVGEDTEHFHAEFDPQ